jgi:hypothetical protein
MILLSPPAHHFHETVYRVMLLSQNPIFSHQEILPNPEHPSPLSLKPFKSEVGQAEFLH